MLVRAGIILATAIAIGVLVMQPTANWNGWLLLSNGLFATALLKLGQDVQKYRKLTDGLGERPQAVLQDSEARLRLALESASMSIWDWKIATDKVTWAGSTERLFGLEEGQFKGTYEAFLDCVHPDDRAQVQQVVSQALAEKRGYQQEFRVVWPNGSVHWLSTQSKLFCDEVGNPTRLIGINRSISAQKQAELALQSSNQRAIDILESMTDAFFTLDQNWQFTYLNPQAETLLNRAASELLGKNVWTEFPEAVDSPFYQQYNRAVTEQVAVQFEAYYPPLENWFEVHAYPTPAGLGVYFQNVTERRQIQERLQQRERQLQAILDYSPAAIYLKDTQGRMLLANRHCESLLHLAPNQSSLGLNSYELLPSEVADHIWQNDQEVIKTRRMVQFEEVLRLPDGSERTYLSLKFPLMDDEGRVYAMGGVSTDISDRKQIEESLHQQAEALVQANLFKDEFLAVISHELRTPLNAILGWVSLLKTRQFEPDKVAEALDTIERNARAQNQLISDLLDISGLMHGKNRLNLRPFDLVPILNGALRTLRPAADAKQIQMVTQMAPNVGTILGDPERMQQVVINLLSNAIKFTPKGGRVEVRLGVVGLWMQLQVKDSGIGIAPEFLPHVFERFRQAERSTTGHKGGLGLGLAIVRQLVEMHGGRVAAASGGEGMGATFTVQLPLSRATQRSLPESCPPQSLLPQNGASGAADAQDGEIEQVLSGLHILVVDDESDACDMMAMMLEPYGAIVTTARSATEARMQVRQRVPDVLVSDIGMPEENGLMLMRQIRSMDQQYGGAMPAIALSAYVREEDQRQALQAGFQSHLSKPVDEMALVTLVAQLTGRSFSETDQGDRYALPMNPG